MISHAKPRPRSRTSLMTRSALCSALGGMLGLLAITQAQAGSGGPTTGLPVQSTQTSQVNAGGTAPTVSVAGTTMTVATGAARTLINWNSFTVGSSDTVNFTFNNRSDIVLNQLVNSTPVMINGAVNASVSGVTGGNVWFSAPGGIVFGSSAVVNVGGLLATTAVASNLTTTGFFNTSNTTSFPFSYPGTSYPGATGYPAGTYYPGTTGYPASTSNYPAISAYPTSNVAGGVGGVTVQSGATVTAHGGLMALIAPFVNVASGADVSAISQANTSGDAGSVLYGAANAFTVSLSQESGGDLDMLQFIINQPSQVTDYPLQLLGTTEGTNVYVASLSASGITGAVVQATGSTQAISASSGFGGEIILSTGADTVTAPTFNTQTSTFTAGGVSNAAGTAYAASGLQFGSTSASQDIQASSSGALTTTSGSTLSTYYNNINLSAGGDITLQGTIGSGAAVSISAVQGGYGVGDIAAPYITAGSYINIAGASVTSTSLSAGGASVSNGVATAINVTAEARSGSSSTTAAFVDIGSASAGANIDITANAGYASLTSVAFGANSGVTLNLTSVGGQPVYLGYGSGGPSANSGSGPTGAAGGISVSVSNPTNNNLINLSSGGDVDVNVNTNAPLNSITSGGAINITATGVSLATDLSASGSISINATGSVSLQNVTSTNGSVGISGGGDITFGTGVADYNFVATSVSGSGGPGFGLGTISGNDVTTTNGYIDLEGSNVSVGALTAGGENSNNYAIYAAAWGTFSSTSGTLTYGALSPAYTDGSSQVYLYPAPPTTPPAPSVTLPVQDRSTPQVDSNGSAPTFGSPATLGDGNYGETITLNAQRTIIGWSSYVIGAGGEVDYVFNPVGSQTAAGAHGNIVLNTISGGSAADIEGVLKSSVAGDSQAYGGNVWFSAPGGVIFGSSAVVNVGGLLATSATIANTDFLNTSSLSFPFAFSGSGYPTTATDDGAGGISVDSNGSSGATIQTYGGLLGLVAPFVYVGPNTTVQSLDETSSGGGAGSVLYGAANTFNVNFTSEPSSDLDLSQFLITSASQVAAYQLQVQGPTVGSNVYFVALGGSTVNGTLINIPGPITANQASTGQGGEVILSTAYDTITAPTYSDNTFTPGSVSNSGNLPPAPAGDISIPAISAARDLQVYASGAVTTNTTYSTGVPTVGTDVTITAGGSVNLLDITSTGGSITLSGAGGVTFAMASANNNFVATSLLGGAGPGGGGPGTGAGSISGGNITASTGYIDLEGTNVSVGDLTAGGANSTNNTYIYAAAWGNSSPGALSYGNLSPAYTSNGSGPVFLYPAPSSVTLPVLNGTTPQFDSSGSAPTLSSAATLSDGNYGETITLNAQRTVIGWTNYTIGAGGEVDYVFNLEGVQTPANARGNVVLNTITGGGPVDIEGVLTSTVAGGGSGYGGNVWFSAPGGIVFGSTAVVNVGGLLATTATFNPNQFVSPTAVSFDLTGTESGYPEGTAGLNQSGYPNGTGYATSGGIGITLDNGAQINGAGSLVALLAPFIQVQPGAEVSNLIAGYGAASVVYGAGSSFTLGVSQPGLSSGLNAIDFASLAIGTNDLSGYATPLSLQGTTNALNVYAAAVSPSAISGAVVNASGAITATTGGGAGGEIILSTGADTITAGVAPALSTASTSQLQLNLDNVTAGGPLRILSNGGVNASADSAGTLKSAGDLTLTAGGAIQLSNVNSGGSFTATATTPDGNGSFYGLGAVTANTIVAGGSVDLEGASVVAAAVAAGSANGAAGTITASAYQLSDYSNYGNASVDLGSATAPGNINLTANAGYVSLTSVTFNGPNSGAAQVLNLNAGNYGPAYFGYAQGGPTANSGAGPTAGAGSETGSGTINMTSGLDADLNVASGTGLVTVGSVYASGAANLTADALTITGVVQGDYGVSATARSGALTASELDSYFGDVHANATLGSVFLTNTTANNVYVTAAQTASVTNATTQTNYGDPIDVTGATAYLGTGNSQDVINVIATNGNATAGDLTAQGAITVSATNGAASLHSATAGTPPNPFNGPPPGPTPITVALTATGSGAGKNVVLGGTDTNGVVGFVTGATSITAQAADDVTVNVAQSIELTSVTAGRSVSLTAPGLTLDALSGSLTGTVGIDVTAAGFTFTNPLTAGSGVTIVGDGALSLGAVTATGGSVALTSASTTTFLNGGTVTTGLGAITAGAVRASQAVTLVGLSVSASSVSAGYNADVEADPASPSNAAASQVDIGPVTASGAVTVSAGGAITLGSATSQAGVITVSGASLSAGALQASGAISLTASSGALGLTSATSTGGGVTLSAPSGAITLTSGLTASGGNAALQSGGPIQLGGAAVASQNFTATATATSGSTTYGLGGIGATTITAGGSVDLEGSSVYATAVSANTASGAAGTITARAYETSSASNAGAASVDIGSASAPGAISLTANDGYASLTSVTFSGSNGGLGQSLNITAVGGEPAYFGYPQGGPTSNNGAGPTAGGGVGSATGSGTINMTSASDADLNVASGSGLVTVGAVTASGAANLSADGLTVTGVVQGASGVLAIARTGALTANELDSSSGNVIAVADRGPVVLTQATADNISVTAGAGAATAGVLKAQSAIAITANNGAAALYSAAASTGSSATRLNGPAPTPAPIVVALSATGTNANVLLGGPDSNGVVGYVTGASSITAQAAQDVTVDVAQPITLNLVSAGRNVNLTAPSLTLGALQGTLTGNVIVTATNGGFTDTAALTAGGGVNVNATGAINLGAVLAEAGNVTLAGSSVNAGAVNASGSLSATANTGAISLTSAEAVGGGLTLSAPAGGVTVTSTLGAGGNATLQGGGAILLGGAASAGGNFTATATSISGTATFGLGAITANTIAAGGSVSLAGASVYATAVTAGAANAAAGTITATAYDTLTNSNAGNAFVDIGSVAASGNITLTANDGYASLTSANFTGANGGAGQTLAVASNGPPQSPQTVYLGYGQGGPSANAGAGPTAAQGGVTGSGVVELSSNGAVQVNAVGALTLDQVNAMDLYNIGSVSVTAGSVSANYIQGGTVSVLATTGNINLTSADALGGLASLSAPKGSVSVLGDLSRVTPSTGASYVAGAISGQGVSITAAGSVQVSEADTSEPSGEGYNPAISVNLTGGQVSLDHGTAFGQINISSTNGAASGGDLVAGAISVSAVNGTASVLNANVVSDPPTEAQAPATLTVSATGAGSNVLLGSSPIFTRTGGAVGPFTDVTLTAAQDVIANIANAVVLNTLQAGRDATVVANGALTLDNAVVGRNLSLTASSANLTALSGQVSGDIDITTTALGLFDTSALTAGGAVNVTAAGPVSLGAVTALGGGVSVGSQGTINLGAVLAEAGNVTLAGSSVSAGAVNASGSLSATANTGAISLTSAEAVGGGLTLSAPAGGVTVTSTLGAGGNATLQGGGAILLGGAASAGGNFTATATNSNAATSSTSSTSTATSTPNTTFGLGAITANTIAAGGSVSLAGASVYATAVTAGAANAAAGTITATAYQTSNASNFGAASVDIGSATAPGAISLTANSGYASLTNVTFTGANGGGQSLNIVAYGYNPTTYVGEPAYFGYGQGGPSDNAGAGPTAGVGAATGAGAISMTSNGDVDLNVASGSGLVNVSSVYAGGAANLTADALTITGVVQGYNGVSATARSGALTASELDSYFGNVTANATQGSVFLTNTTANNVYVTAAQTASVTHATSQSPSYDPIDVTGATASLGTGNSQDAINLTATNGNATAGDLTAQGAITISAANGMAALHSATAGTPAPTISAPASGPTPITVALSATGTNANVLLGGPDSNGVVGYVTGATSITAQAAQDVTVNVAQPITLNLVSAGRNATLTAPSLTLGALQGALTGDTVIDTTAGGFTDTSALTLGGSLSVTAMGTINLGAVTSGGGVNLTALSGDVDLSSATVQSYFNVVAQGSLTSGPITAGSLSSGSGSIDLRVGLESAQNAQPNPAGAIVTGALAAGDDISIVSAPAGATIASAQTSSNYQSSGWVHVLGYLTGPVQSPYSTTGQYLASVGPISIGAVSAGSGVALQSSGAVTVTGQVISGGQVNLVGASVTGAAMSAGSIVSDGSSFYVDATAGGVTLGTITSQAPQGVNIGATGAVALAGVTSQAGVVNLVGASVSAGAVTSAGSANVSANSGAVSLVSATSGGGVFLSAPAGAISVAASLQANGGDATLQAGGAITLGGAASSSGTFTATAINTSGPTTYGLGAITANTIVAGGSADLEGASVYATAVTAGAASGAAGTIAAHAYDTLTNSNAGSAFVDIGSVAASGNITLTANDGYASLTSANFTGANGGAGQTLALAATSNGPPETVYLGYSPIAYAGAGPTPAQGGVTGGGVVELSSNGAVQVNAVGALTLDQVNALGAVNITAGSVSANSIQGGTVSVQAATGNINLTSADALGGLASLSAPKGSVSVLGDLSLVTPSTGASYVAGAISGQGVSITAAGSVQVSEAETSEPSGEGYNPAISVNLTGGQVSLDHGTAFGQINISSTNGAASGGDLLAGAISVSAVNGTASVLNANVFSDPPTEAQAPATLTVSATGAGSNVLLGSSPIFTRTGGAVGPFTDVTLTAAQDVIANIANTVVLNTVQAGRDATVVANGALTLDNAVVGRNLSLTASSANLTALSGQISGDIDITTTALGLFDTSALTAGGAVNVTAAGPVSLGAVTALGGGVSVGSQGAISVTAASAAGDIAIAANGGTAALGSATLTSGGLLSVSASGAASNISLGQGLGFVQGAGQVNLQAGQDVTVDVTQPITLTLVSAGRNLTLTAPSVTLGTLQGTLTGDIGVTASSGGFTDTEALSAGGAVTVNATGAVTIGAAASQAANVTLTGSSISAGAVTSSGSTSVTANAGAIALTSVTSGGGVALSAPAGAITVASTLQANGGDATLLGGADISLGGSASASGSFTATATNISNATTYGAGAITAGAIAAGGLVDLEGASVLATNVSAGAANGAGGTITAVAYTTPTGSNAGNAFVDLGSVAAPGNITLTANDGYASLTRANFTGANGGAGQTLSIASVGSPQTVYLGYGQGGAGASGGQGAVTGAGAIELSSNGGVSVNLAGPVALDQVNAAGPISITADSVSANGIYNNADVFGSSADGTTNVTARLGDITLGAVETVYGPANLTASGGVAAGVVVGDGVAVTAGGLADINYVSTAITVSNDSGSYTQAFSTTAPVQITGAQVTLNQGFSFGPFTLAATNGAATVGDIEVGGGAVAISAINGAASLHSVSLFGTDVNLSSFELSELPKPQASVVSITASGTGGDVLIGGPSIAADRISGLGFVTGAASLTAQASEDVAVNVAQPITLALISAGRSVSLAAPSVTLGAVQGSLTGDIGIDLTGGGFTDMSTLTAGGAVSISAAGPVALGAVTALGGDVNISSQGAANVGAATAAGNIVIASTGGSASLGSATLTGGLLSVSALGASSDINLGQGSGFLQGAGQVTLQAGEDVTVSVTGPALLTSAVAGRNLTVSGSSTSLGQAQLGGDLTISSGGDASLGAVTVGGDLSLSAAGLASIGSVAIAGAGQISAGDLTIAKLLSAPSLSLEALKGALTVGGAAAPTDGSMWIGAAEFGRLSATTSLDLYAGSTSGTARGELVVSDLSVNPSLTPNVSLFAAPGQTVSITGAVAPTVSGGTFTIGSTTSTAWTPSTILISGSLGAATRVTDTQFTGVQAFQQVTLSSAGDVLIGSPNFFALIQATPAANINIAGNQPAGVTATGSAVGQVYVAAGQLNIDAPGKVVQQNSSGSGSSYSGLYLLNGASTSETALSLDPPSVVDLFGSFVNASGALTSGPLASQGTGLQVLGLLTGSQVPDNYRFNGCVISPNAMCGVTVGAELGIQVMQAQQTAAAEASATTGTQQLAQPVLLAIPPSLPVATEQLDPLVTGVGNEEIWRNRRSSGGSDK